MTTRPCSSCARVLPLEEYRVSNVGPSYKTCNQCRSRQRERSIKLGRARKKPHHQACKPVTACDECAKPLTPNRAIVLEKRHLCRGCWRRRFGV